MYSRGNAVQGNHIGTDVAGTTALGNFIGVYLYGASGNTIGGTVTGAGNLISGNYSVGVWVTGANNQVQGDYIGTDASGTQALANGDDGVFIYGPNNTVGGTTAAARNIISANHNPGVSLIGAVTTGNLIEGNYIGTDVSGKAGLGNSNFGVLIDVGPSKVSRRASAELHDLKWRFRSRG
jgi:hypothetical protein